MRIRSGPAWVVDSGVVTTFGGHGLLLAVALPEDNLAVELEFSSDGSGVAAVHSMETDVGYRLRCVNFDDTSGRGSAEPVLLGALGEDLVFLHFRVQLFGRSTDRTVFYTVYRVRKDEVGWTDQAG